MKRLVNKFLLKADGVLPCTDFWDNIISLKRFVVSHKRLPSKRMLFNDVLYNIKTSSEITNPLRVFVSDKELVKIYIKSIVGDKYNVPTKKVLRSYADVANYDFPPNCCIKPTQASGQVIIRKNNSDIDFQKIKSWFDINYYRGSRERNYKTLLPKVIVEPLIFGEEDLADYRIFCYKGKAKLISIDVGKYSGYSRAFYDTDWVKLPFSLNYPMLPSTLERPGNLAEMISIAESLSENFDFIRIDIYSNGEECLVGEITNCHASGNQRFIPVTAEYDASKIIFN